MIPLRLSNRNLGEYSVTIPMTNQRVKEVTITDLDIPVEEMGIFTDKLISAYNQYERFKLIIEELQTKVSQLETDLEIRNQSEHDLETK